MDQTIGNTSLVSNEEEQVAKLLKDKYLEHTNSISVIAYPKRSFYTRYGKRFLDILISFLHSLYYCQLTLF